MTVEFPDQRCFLVQAHCVADENWRQQTFQLYDEIEQCSPNFPSQYNTKNWVKGLIVICHCHLDHPIHEFWCELIMVKFHQ
jgi:hypothetical protein